MVAICKPSMADGVVHELWRLASHQLGADRNINMDVLLALGCCEAVVLMRAGRTNKDLIEDNYSFF